MIVAIMGYGLAVGALAALAAWLIERAQAAFGRARKHAWVGGIVATLLVPCIVIGLRETGEGSAAAMTAFTANPVAVHDAGSTLRAAVTLGEAELAGWPLDDLLAGLWFLASALLIGVYGFSVWRLQRRARTWRRASAATPERHGRGRT